MDDQQPIIVPPIVRIPQVSPQVAVGKRWVYIPPEIRRDATSQQSPSYSSYRSYTYFLPQTPRPLPLYGTTDQLSTVDDMMRNVSPHTSSMGIPPGTGSIPRSLSGYYSISERRPDPGMCETLMGCASLLFLGIMVLVLLYYLSM
jgi:hypothetical protein